MTYFLPQVSISVNDYWKDGDATILANLRDWGYAVGGRPYGPQGTACFLRELILAGIRGVIFRERVTVSLVMDSS